MEQHPLRIAHKSVPPLEIISAVPARKTIFVIYRQRLAYSPRRHQFFQLVKIGHEPTIERYGNFSSAAFFRRSYFGAPFESVRKRLLGNNIVAFIQRPYYIFVMNAVNRRNDNRVGALFIQHFVKIIINGA